MNTTIRAVRRAELPEVCELLALAFDEAAPQIFVAQTERDSTFRFRHGRVAIVDGRIAGYVRIFARTMLVRGVPVAAGGIGSVATHPDARHAGIATALLRDALDQMRNEGMAVSFLFTGIAGFYERLGYRLVREPSFEADARDAASSPHAVLYGVRAMTERDVSRLLAIYRRAIAGGTGAITRTRRTWRDAAHWLAEDADGCFVADGNGVPVAYMRSRCRTYGHQILEAECAPHHDGAVAALLAATGRRAVAHRERLVALAPGEHPLATAMRALASATEATDVRFPMMARIVSLDALLDELLPYLRTRAAGHPGPSLRLGLTSHDGESMVLDVTTRSVALRRNGATHALDAGATLDALFGQRRASTLVRPRPHDRRRRQHPRDDARCGACARRRGAAVRPEVPRYEDPDADGGAGPDEGQGAAADRGEAAGHRIAGGGRRARSGRDRGLRSAFVLSWRGASDAGGGAANRGGAADGRTPRGRLAGVLRIRSVSERAGRERVLRVRDAGDRSAGAAPFTDVHDVDGRRRG